MLLTVVLPDETNDTIHLASIPEKNSAILYKGQTYKVRDVLFFTVEDELSPVARVHLVKNRSTIFL